MRFHQSLEEVENREPVCITLLAKDMLCFIKMNADDTGELGFPNDNIPVFTLRQSCLSAQRIANGLGGRLAEILPGPDPFQNALCKTRPRSIGKHDLVRVELADQRTDFSGLTSAGRSGHEKPFSFEAPPPIKCPK